VAWIPASHIEYRAAIGGVLYRNVAEPVVCNGKSLIALARDETSGQLAVSLKLAQEDGSQIASVENNNVVMHQNEEYVLLHGPTRTSVLHRKTGRLWLDLIKAVDPEIELSISCILFGDSGYPILLHPDRTKFGVANENRPPNIAFMTFNYGPVKQSERDSS
jgi:hypothetical protein